MHVLVKYKEHMFIERRLIMVTRLFAAMCVLAGMTAFGVTMPEVVSHRGESKDRPENTMAAFRLAFERGVDGVECDVYCTSDGVPVIIHDSTTGRTAGSGVNLTVTSSTWDQLKDVQVVKFRPWSGRSSRTTLRSFR